MECATSEASIHRAIEAAETTERGSRPVEETDRRRGEGVVGQWGSAGKMEGAEECDWFGLLRVVRMVRWRGMEY